MRILAAVSICLLVAGCDTFATGPKETGIVAAPAAAPVQSTAAARPPREEFRANYEPGRVVGRLDGSPTPADRRASAPVDIDVKSFDAAYETCRARSRGSEANLAMAAARLAAGSTESHVVIDMGSTPQARQASATFAQCMAAKGYVNVR